MANQEKVLTDRRVAIIATDGVEESELLEPRKALEEAGAKVDLISLKSGNIETWSDQDWGSSIPVTKTIHEATAADYDALMLPGGVINADRLRLDEDVVEFVGDIVRAGKPVAAICHALWTLIETGEVEGRNVTSWPSLKTDLENAGAFWVDEEVVTDEGWVTSRKPEDLPAFNEKMIEEFAEGEHAGESDDLDEDEEEEEDEGEDDEILAS